MRSNTLVFAAIVLAAPSFAWWTSEAPPPCESETKTLSHSVSHPSETVAPTTLTYPSEVPTWSVKPSHTHSSKPISSAEGYPTSSHEGHHTSSYESVSTSEIPTPTPTPSSSHEGYPTSSHEGHPTSSHEGVSTSEIPTPTLSPTLSVPVEATTTAEAASTSAVLSVSIYAPPATGYSNGTVTSSQAPLSPSGVPTSKPSGITMPISGASNVGGWGMGSVILVVGVVFVML